MVTIPVKLLGGVRAELGTSRMVLTLPEGATVSDLKEKLKTLGIDLNTENIIVVLNDLGIQQWSPDRLLTEGDEVAIFPNIAGGSAGVSPELKRKR